jgi:uncharacterized membrane protein
MRPDYNRIAGRNVDRLAALSDGIFAIAMTLLVLDLHAPLVGDIRGDADLLHALFGLAPRLAVYVMSFLTLGIFWVGQQTQLNNLSHADRDLTWIHLAFLFTVTVMPLSTGLMAEFIHYRTALVIYWASILMFGILLLASWRYAAAPVWFATKWHLKRRARSNAVLFSPRRFTRSAHCFRYSAPFGASGYRARATELCGSTEDRRVTPLVGRLRGARPA